MRANANYIARLIYKLLRGQDTAEERASIEHWRKSDDRNDKLIEDLRDAKNIEEDLNFFAGLDEDQAWQKIRQESAEGKKKWTVVRAVAMLLLVLGAALIYNLQKETIDSGGVQVTSIKRDISPAQQGALLVLADGSVMPLADSNKTIDPKIVALGSKQNTRDDDMPAETVRLQFNTLVVPKGNFYKLTLEDGTLVWVNASSQLKFPVKFKHDERRVILEGEAYFEVAHDAQRPFFVESRGSEVKVLGTHFNINAYSHNVRTTLSSGKVQVSHSGNIIVLEPGEYANIVSGQLSKGKADLEHDLSWHNNQFYFKKETIAEIASTLSKWYDIQVRFKKGVSLNKVYTGNFKRDVKLSEVLEMLTYVCDLKFELRGNELIVENK
ncbi:FecR family protein [Sphingobacterium thalpophilum]|uniref:FecR family protein n=1 Tax=Sphingobacterium thalpophilum TaxID=259 RepID=UPI002D7977DC|nr:FecR domain-containing protein [Sphingobacterium thalpophilum]